MKSPENRAVITGMGVIAPNGNSLEAFWHNTLACRSGVAKISRFPTENYPVTVAAEVKDFDIRDHLPQEGKVRFRRLSLQTRYGIAAAHEAVRHAGLQAADFDARPPVDIVVGVSSNALEMIEHATEVMRKKGPGKIIPYGVSACQPHAVACGIMDTLRIQGSRRTFSSACPAGLNALGEAHERIRDGASDLVICGGVDAPITPLMMASMHLEGLADKLMVHTPTLNMGEILKEASRQLYTVQSPDELYQVFESVLRKSLDTREINIYLKQEDQFHRVYPAGPVKKRCAEDPLIQLVPERYQDAEFREQFSGMVGQEVEKLGRMIDQINTFAHPPEVERIPMDHLLLNAAEALEGRNGEIMIHASEGRDPEGRRIVEIEIHDNGPGMPDELLDDPFSPFTTMKAQGLGLAIAHRTLEDLNGSITLSSTPRGTSVHLTLPVAQEGETL